jgi:hypothetical protein
MRIAAGILIIISGLPFCKSPLPLRERIKVRGRYYIVILKEQSD